MSKFVFCNIAHMKFYRGITKDDKPVNGGKFVNENGTAYECYNFFPVNHFCYGYFQHRGNTLNIGRVDEFEENADVLHNVTVIWVANRKIVGWYENAEMFRYCQSFNEPEFDKNHEWWDHWFKAHEENVYLLPEDTRNFDIPSASKQGKGIGMGQSNIWYADSDWGQRVFLPAVEKYLEALKGKYPIKYLKAEDLYKKISPTRYSDEDLFDSACDMLNAGQYLRAMKVFNHLIYRVSTPYKGCLAKYYKGLILEKLLLYDEALKSYKQAVYEFNQLDTEEKLTSLDLDCYWQIGRIYSVLGKVSIAYAIWKKLFEEETNIKFKCDALLRMMWICHDDDDRLQLRELLKVYDELHTNLFIDEVAELKKSFRKRNATK